MDSPVLATLVLVTAFSVMGEAPAVEVIPTSDM
jgi:hypothetical protein